MKEHYLDNAATTKPSDKVVEVINKVLKEDWGNPSSLHRKGQDAESYVKKARRTIASILMCPEESVFFTSCATESSNTAIYGAVSRMKRQGKHILTTKSEHPATGEPLKLLAEEGFEIEEIENDISGKVDLKDLEKKLRSDTILISSIQINNETGCINPIKEMGKIIKSKNPRCLFHVDATQGFAKYPLFPDKWGVDLISASAHKISGPKGIGLLYVKRGLHIPSLIVGGGQENHMRSGTENVPYIAGFGIAAEELWKEKDTLLADMMHLKCRFVQELTEQLEGIHVNGPAPEEAAAHIVNLRIDGVRSEVLLHALEDDGVYVSSGSACSSNKPSDKSRALAAIGLTSDQIDHSLRVSLGRDTTWVDLQACIDSMKKQVPMLRLFIRK